MAGQELKSDTEQNETYKPLELGFEYPRQVICESIIDDHEGFRLLFSSSHQRWMRIGFVNSLAYRKIDEGDFLRTFPRIPEPTSIAYEVFSSEFLEWFNVESCDVRSNVRHFLFLSSNDIIDVLAFDAPKIELL